MGLVGQALGPRLEFVGAAARLVGILQLAQVAQGGQFLRVVDQLTDPRGRVQPGLEQAGDVRQGLADAGQDLVETGAVEFQPVMYLVQGASSQMSATAPDSCTQAWNGESAASSSSLWLMLSTR